MEVTNKKSYSELILLNGYETRSEYLKLLDCINGDIYKQNRPLYDEFLHSPLWRNIRRRVIARDYGCDLGLSDFPITGRIIVHHINPITRNDIVYKSDSLINPDNLITVSLTTHNYIHWGKKPDFNIHTRYKGDTLPPWKIKF